MVEHLENIVTERESRLGKVKNNLVLAGTSLVASTGLATVMPTLYSAMLNSPDVDKFPHYYTLTLMTGIAVALPVIGVYCLKEAYKNARELSQE